MIRTLTAPSPSPTQDDTRAIQSAIDTVHAAGGGTVVLADGLFRAAGLELKSNVGVHLERGTTLKGLDGTEPYERRGYLVGLFHTMDAERVSLTGSGILDGNGDTFFDPTRRHDSGCYAPARTRQGEAFKRMDTNLEDGPWAYDKRPNNMIVFGNCRDIEVSGLTIANPAAWCMHFGDCDTVNVHGLRVMNTQPVPNCDGIHITNSCDVMIRDCFFNCGDDCIAVTGVRHEPHWGPAFNSTRGACENVLIDNCNLKSRSSGIRIGWGQNPVRNVVAGNLVITNSNRGINVCSRIGGGVERVRIHDVIIETELKHGHWWGLGDAIHVSSMPWSFEDSLPLAGTIRDVVFSHITATADSGIVVYADTPGDIQNLGFQDVELHVRRGKLDDLYGGNLDLMPSEDPAFGIFACERGGMHVHGVHGLRLKNTRIHMAEDLADYYKAPVVLDACQDVSGADS